MVCAQETRLFILVTDGREISANNLKVRILPDIVDGHLEHPEVKVCDGTEGATCYEHDRLFFRVAKDGVETMMREGVVRWGCELPGRGARRVWRGRHYGRRAQRANKKVELGMDIWVAEKLFINLFLRIAKPCRILR